MQSCYPNVALPCAEIKEKSQGTLKTQRMTIKWCKIQVSGKDYFAASQNKQKAQILTTVKNNRDSVVKAKLSPSLVSHSLVKKKRGKKVKLYPSYTSLMTVASVTITFLQLRNILHSISCLSNGWLESKTEKPFWAWSSQVCFSSFTWLKYPWDHLSFVMTEKSCSIFLAMVRSW